MCSASSLFKRVAARYVEEHRAGRPGASIPAAEATAAAAVPAGGAGAAAPAPSSAEAAACDGGCSCEASGVATTQSPQAGQPHHQRKGSGGSADRHNVHLVHGIDVSTLDADTVYIVLFSAIILNSDLRSPAVKEKMTCDVFVQRNSCIPGLSGLPASFFEGVYDEIAVQGLPMSDDVPMAPVTVLPAGGAGRGRPAPAPETVAALERLTGGGSPERGGRDAPMSPSGLRRAFSWVRSSLWTTTGSAAQARDSLRSRRQ